MLSLDSKQPSNQQGQIRFIKIIPPTIKDITLENSLRWITLNPKKVSLPISIIEQEIQAIDNIIDKLNGETQKLKERKKQKQQKVQTQQQINLQTKENGQTQQQTKKRSRLAMIQELQSQKMKIITEYSKDFGGIDQIIKDQNYEQQNSNLDQNLESIPPIISTFQENFSNYLIKHSQSFISQFGEQNSAFGQQLLKSFQNMSQNDILKFIQSDIQQQFSNNHPQVQQQLGEIIKEVSPDKSQIILQPKQHFKILHNNPFLSDNIPEEQAKKLAEDEKQEDLKRNKKIKTESGKDKEKKRNYTQKPKKRKNPFQIIQIYQDETGQYNEKTIEGWDIRKIQIVDKIVEQQPEQQQIIQSEKQNSDQIQNDQIVQSTSNQPNVESKRETKECPCCKQIVKRHYCMHLSCEKPCKRQIIEERMRQFQKKQKQPDLSIKDISVSSQTNKNQNQDNKEDKVNQQIINNNSNNQQEEVDNKEKEENEIKVEEELEIQIVLDQQ